MDSDKSAIGNLKKMIGGRIAKKFAPAKKVEVEIESGPSDDDESSDMPDAIVGGEGREGGEYGGEQEGYAAEKLEAMGGDPDALSPEDLSQLESILKKAGC